MTQASQASQSQASQPWAATVALYRHPHHGKAWRQIANTFLPFAGLWYLMYLASFHS